MKNLGFLKLLSIVLIASTVLFSCNKDEYGTNTMTSNTIADIASNNANFSILKAALEKAGLLSVVKDANANLTIFAPNNTANVTSSELSNGSAPTLNSNKTVKIDITNGVKVNTTSNVILANVQTTNGVIHVIDKVIVLP